jgi:hypothetical protein
MKMTPREPGRRRLPPDNLLMARRPLSAGRAAGARVEWRLGGIGPAALNGQEMTFAVTIDSSLEQTLLERFSTISGAASRLTDVSTWIQWTDVHRSADFPVRGVA